MVKFSLSISSFDLLITYCRNEDLHVLQNLESILEISFEPSGVIDKLIDDNEKSSCAICYLDEQENEPLTDQCCNKACSKKFHNDCLSEWLQSLPTAKHSFGTIYGSCPYCSSDISIRL